MKSTGMFRKVDEMGRLVLPIELRRVLEIEEKDSLEIFVDDSSIILRKYQPGCMICGNVQHVGVFKGRRLCNDCIKELQDMDIRKL